MMKGKCAYYRSLYQIMVLLYCITAGLVMYHLLPVMSLAHLLICIRPEYMQYAFTYKIATALSMAGLSIVWNIVAIIFIIDSKGESTSPVRVIAYVLLSTAANVYVVMLLREVIYPSLIATYK